MSYQPSKPFWKMDIPELKEYINQFRKCTKKKKKINYRRRFTIKKRNNKYKYLKIKLRNTRKNID